MDNKWIWIGIGGVVLLLLLMGNRGGSSSSGPTLDPNAEEAARFQFAGQGFSALTQFATADAQAKSSATIASYQLEAEKARDSALVETARMQAQAQQKASQGNSNASIIGSIATVAVAILSLF